jgi:hypothetical protein
LRLITCVLLAGLCCFFWLSQTPLSASTPDEWFNEPNIYHQIEYPNKVQFYLSGFSDEDLLEVRLEYFYNSSKILSYKYADPASGGKIQLEVTLETSGPHYIPPGTQITYFFELTSIQGKKYQSPQIKFHYLDPSINWKSTKSKKMTLIWHDNNEDDINSLIEDVNESNSHLTELLNIPNPLPITGVILNNRQESDEAFPRISAAASKEELYGGFAFSNYDTFIVTGLSRAGIIHESTHLLLDQSLKSPTTRLPAWLNEGIAMHFEGNHQTTGKMLQAYSSGQIFDIRSMETVPGKPSEVRLFYLISESFVAYLFSEYGDNKIRHLITHLDSGQPIEDAIFSTYKLNLQKIQSDWLDSLSGRFENRVNVDIGSFGTSLILSMTFLIGLLFSGIGWLRYKANSHDSEDHLRSDEYEEGYWDRK